MADSTYYADGKDVELICDAIRTKGGAAGKILWPDIPSAILNIPQGGGGDGILEIDMIYLSEVFETIEIGGGRIDPDAPIGTVDLDIRWGWGPDRNYTEHFWYTDEYGTDHYYRIQWWTPDESGLPSDCVDGPYYGCLGCYYEGLIPDTRKPDEWNPPPGPKERDYVIGTKSFTGGYFELRMLSPNEDLSVVELFLEPNYFVKDGGWLPRCGPSQIVDSKYRGGYDHMFFDIYKFMQEGVLC